MQRKKKKKDEKIILEKSKAIGALQRANGIKGIIVNTLHLLCRKGRAMANVYIRGKMKQEVLAAFFLRR